MTHQHIPSAAERTEIFGTHPALAIDGELRDLRARIAELEAVKANLQAGIDNAIELQNMAQSDAEKAERALAAALSAQPVKVEPTDELAALSKLCDQLDAMKRTMFLRPGTGQHYSYLVHEDVAAYVEQARAALAAAQPVVAQEPVYFVKSMIHPNGWHECSEYEFGGHVKAGFTTRVLYPSPTAPDAAVRDAERYRWLLNNYARGDGYNDIDAALNDGEAEKYLSPAIDAQISASPAVLEGKGEAN